MQNISAKDFIEFASNSPTPFQAVETIAQRLLGEGFTQLYEHEQWSVVPGGKYFITRNRSSIIALVIPETGLAPFSIVASHSDSPMPRLKPHCDNVTLGHYVRLNVEKYGSPVLSTWLDRPLSVAGRVLVREGDEIETRLVDLHRDALLIPNMPIHLARDINDGYTYNLQVDLMPLYGDETAAGKFIEEIASCVGAKPEQLVASDLFAYNRQPGTVWGASGEFFSSPRIDNLECAFASLHAFLTMEKPGQTAVYAVFDNEEVGSTSKQGANSTLLGDILNRICGALGANDDQTRALIASSFMVSADNAHGVNPNHPEKYDADNRTWMNGGIVVKHSANQKYATDAVSRAIFETICARVNVPIQQFANRSDIPGGSTLGTIANSNTSMNTVDIGLAQLAMHSSYETAGTRDIIYMADGLRAFYETKIITRADGSFTLVK